MATGSPEVTLRFLAAPTDVTYGGTVHGGKILEWIDKAGYACAVGWSGHYCVTAYVGNIRFARPIAIGEIVEIVARLVHTGRTSMHVLCRVSSANPRDGAFAEATECMTVFVAVDPAGKPTEVPRWQPETDRDAALEADALRHAKVRADIADAMRQQAYTSAGTAPQVTLRFLAAPTDINWGGKVHGGTVMRWIDEAAYVCAVGWSGTPAIAVYAGGVRFYRPLLIGSVVEVEARLLHTGRTSMHIAVHVRSGDPKTSERDVTTHCLIIFVALDDEGRSTPVRRWEPVTSEDIALEQHARHLMRLRESLVDQPGQLASGDRRIISQL